MKKLLTLLILMMPLALMAQTYTTPYSKKEQKAAKRWAKKGSWRNGFTKASPDATVNLVDFQRQVERNPEQWNALFAWLQTHDVTALPAGKHPIEGTELVVNIQDDVNLPVEKRGTESHRKKIDFQWVVSGSEGFGILDHETSTVKDPYNEKKDVVRYNYDVQKTMFITNKLGCFNLFFPGDWHIAKVGKDDGQKFRVVVIKVDYKD